MTWKKTGYGYDLWEGKKAPPCSYCMKPLDKVEIKSTRVLVWDNNYTADGLTLYTDGEDLVADKAYCPNCGNPISLDYGIGIMGVNAFYHKTE